MKLWLISQDANSGYDIYSDAVVAAESEQEARKVYPDHNYVWSQERNRWEYPGGNEGQVAGAVYSIEWADPVNVNVRLIGKAVNGTQRGTICASFHAG